MYRNLGNDVLVVTHIVQQLMIQKMNKVTSCSRNRLLINCPLDWSNAESFFLLSLMFMWRFYLINERADSDQGLLFILKDKWGDSAGTLWGSTPEPQLHHSVGTGKIRDFLLVCMRAHLFLIRTSWPIWLFQDW